MSLIQDALKRKTEEQPLQPQTAPPVPPTKTPPPAAPQQQTPAPAAPQQTPHPAAPQQRSTPPTPGSSSKKRMIIALSLLVMLILLVVGGSYILLSRSGSAAEPTQNFTAEQPTQPTAIAPAPALSAKDPVNEDTSKKEKPARKINWPKLTFSGCAASGDEILAIINGRMLSKGNEINGVTVLQIGKNRVLLEFEGEKRLFRLHGE